MSAPTPDRLQGIRAKIERAKEHVRDFESRLRTFMQTDPYGIRVEDDPKTGDKIQRVEIRSQTPADLPLVAGEVIYHLRSTLDHLVWQLVEANGGTPGKETGFPIFDAASKYKTDSARKVKGMSPVAVTVLDLIQPYKGGNDSLWKLHELNNFDKHRLSLGPGYGQKYVDVLISPDLALSGMVPPVEFVGTGKPGVPCPILEDGTIIGRIEGRGQSNEDMQFQITFEIAFRQPQIVEGEPVLPFLHQMSHLVEGIVNQFEWYLR
jgi:hypothetical protein